MPNDPKDIYEEPIQLKGWQKRLAAFFGFMLSRALTTFIDRMDVLTKPLGKPMAEKMLLNPNLPPETRALLEGYLKEEAIPFAVIGTALGLGALIGALLGITAPGQAAGKQFASSIDHWQLLELRDALTGYHRGTVTREQLDDVFNKGGYHDWQWPIMEELSELRLDPITSINLHRRFGEKYPDILKEMKDQGWTDERIEQLLDATLFYPGPGDLVNWQAKEVFEPAMIEKYGLKEELEGIERDPFYKAGMDDEQIANFWMAHWQHASWTQVQDMLFRGIINEDDVRAWFRLVEIPPFWRQKLIDTAYHTYTRVDVRRMHKLEIIDDAGLLQAYKDLGYNEERAQHMVEFTIAYNEDPPDNEKTDEEKEKDKERDLTKSDILNGYRDGLLLLDEARISLASLRYSNEEVNYYIARVNYENEQDDVSAQLRYYHDAYIRSVMTRNEIIDKMGELNLEGSRQERLFAIWDLERMARVTKPTKAEILSFLRKEIITPNEAKEELLGLGYSERYVGWYLETV